MTKNTEKNMDGMEMLVQWLRDAHAMEETAEEILERQVSRSKDYPEIRKKLEEHLLVTRSQAERIQGCIERLDMGDIGTDAASKAKDLIGKVMGNMSALANATARDEIVKNSLADYAFEQFEIACYTSLVAACEALDQPEIGAICQDILTEEKEMAAWIEGRIGRITNDFLARNGALSQAAE